MLRVVNSLQVKPALKRLLISEIQRLDLEAKR